MTWGINLRKALLSVVAVILFCGVLCTQLIHTAYAKITVADRPSDGTTYNQPFPTGAGGSQNFRIPSIVNYNGTLVAAVDARWNTIADGYGLDTIVSRSSDDGSTWNYTFANHLGDNGNVYSTSSTAFIDPALATDGKTIWMLVDLYPAGGYINRINYGTGYDDVGHLLLKKGSESSFNYYVGDYSNGYASIYTTAGKKVDGVAVDEYFNYYTVSGSTYTKVSNVFFSDCDYKVLTTSYLYLTSSTDGGKTWSAPTMLNSQVKRASDQFYGVGPGKGITTTLADGTTRIMFCCYEFMDGTDRFASVIYSDDNGKTWTRSADMTSHSSEASIADLGNGTMYMFARHGGYYISHDYGATWGGRQETSGITYASTCEVNVLVYSKKIDGKTAILLSAPDNNGRTNGKIFVGLVQNDGSIEWRYTYSVNNSMYMYSSMAETNDGSIAILYEDGEATIMYKKLSIKDIIGRETLDGVSIKNALYTFKSLDGGYSVDNNYIYLNIDNQNNGYPGSFDRDALYFTQYDSTSGLFYITNSNADSTRALYFNNQFDEGNITRSSNTDKNYLFSIYREANAGETSSGELAGFVRVYNRSDIINGNKYLIVAERNGIYNVVYPTVNSNSKSAHYVKITSGANAITANGTIVNTDNAEYVIESSNSGYTIRSGSIYLNIDNQANGYPNGKTKDELYLTEYKGNDKSQFYITNSSDDFTRGLYFTSYFDEGYLYTSSNDREGYLFNIYRKAESGENSDEIKGYVKVKSKSEIVSGASYLIVAERNGIYNIAYPSSDYSNKNTQYAAASVKTLTEVEKKLASALYTFKRSNNGYVLQNGSIYLNIDNQENGYPGSTISDELYISSVGTKWNDDSLFYITNSADRNTRALWFDSYYDEGDINVIGEMSYGYLFNLYREAKVGENSSSELPGYVKLNNIYEITDNAKYLVVAVRYGTYYVLYPSTDNSNKNAHFITVTKSETGSINVA